MKASVALIIYAIISLNNLKILILINNVEFIDSTKQSILK